MSPRPEFFVHVTEVTWEPFSVLMGPRPFVPVSPAFLTRAEADSYIRDVLEPKATEQWVTETRRTWERRKYLSHDRPA